MALQILNNNGTVYLQGNINASTAQNLVSHFNYLMKDSKKEVTVDIDKVTEIDASGVLALKTLFLKALRNKKTFSIVGYGCKELHTDFNTPSAA